MARTEETPLFATSPVVEHPGTDPVIIVGLPRSGSSYLSYVLSRIRDWYVFDDLYLYRKATALGANGILSEPQLKGLIAYLGRLLKARIRTVTFRPPDCSLDDVDRFEEAMLETFRARPVKWHQLMEEWLTRLAQHHHCRFWGYKTPQEFMHIDMLKNLFPGVRFAFVYRDPRQVMSSYKFIRPEDGDRSQYHPAVYAWFWRMSVEAVDAASKKMQQQIHYVKFENLIADPNKIAKNLASYLGSTVDGNVSRSDPNSSFQSKPRMGITPTEEWICQKIAGQSMLKMGYELSDVRPRLKDVGDLIKTSGRFIVYQARRIYRGQGARQAVKFYIKQLAR